MGRTKSKEKFRQAKKKKLYSKTIQEKMRELRGQGHSREKVCEILKVPLVEERSWRRYTNGPIESGQTGTSTCTFNRPFNFITEEVRVQFEKAVVTMFRQKSKTRGFPQVMLTLCCHEVMKLPQFKDDPNLKNLKFSEQFTRRLMKNHGLTRTSRQSAAKFFTEFELEQKRDGMHVKLAAYSPADCINTDETGLFINIRNKFSIRHKSDIFFEEENCKLRVTFLPFVSPVNDLGIAPSFMGHSWATLWKLDQRKEEKLMVRLSNGEQIEVRRYKCKFEGLKFYIYKNSSAWMIEAIWMAEMSRVSQHLFKNFPKRKFAIICDNFRAHKYYKSANLETIFLPAHTTPFLQALDVSIFGHFKNCYRKSLNEVTFQRAGLNKKCSLSEEEGIKLTLKVWSKIGMNVIRHGFWATKLRKFDFLKSTDFDGFNWSETDQAEYLESKENENELVELIENLKVNETTQIGPNQISNVSLRD